MIRRMLILAGVLLVVSPAAAQYFGKNKVRYDSFKWMVYSTPHFRISFYDKVEPSLIDINGHCIACHLYPEGSSLPEPVA